MVPYILGFQPRESIVVVSLRGSPALMSTTFRLDIPPECPDHVPARRVVARVCELVGQQGFHEVITVMFSERADVSADLATQMRGRLRAAGVTVTECLRADGDRWWSYTCDDATCCPAEGTPYEPDTSSVAASAVWAGMQRRPDRASLGEVFAWADGGPARALGDGLSETHVDDPSDVETRHQVLESYLRLCEHEATPADQALVVRAVQHVGLRDMLWEVLSRDTAADDLEVWAAMSRGTPDDLCAPVAAMGAFAAWLAGNGALASHGVERALACDPGYSMARLIDGVLQAGVSPAAWEVWRRDQEDDLPTAG